jgi:hypothetical protein
MLYNNGNIVNIDKNPSSEIAPYVVDSIITKNIEITI